MDLWSVLKTVVRRWYIATPILVATAFGIGMVSEVVAPTYRAQGTALLAVPSLDIEALKQQRRESLNPFLSFNPSLSISAEAIARILRDDSVRTRMSDLGLDPKFLIFSEQNIPAVTAISVHDSPDTATRSVRYLLDQSIATMTQLQQSASVPADQFIRIGTISYSKTPEVITARQNRARMGLGAFGAAAAVAGALAVDAAATYMRNARAERRRSRSPRRGGRHAAATLAANAAPEARTPSPRPVTADEPTVGTRA